MIGNQSYYWRSMWITALSTVVFVGLSGSLAWGQVPVPPVPDTVNDTINSNQDAVKDSQDKAKEATPDAQEKANQAAKDAREKVQDARTESREAVKDAAKDARENIRDAAKSDSPEGVRDAAKAGRENIRDAAKEAQETKRDAVDAARATTQDAREATRDARDATRELQEDTRGVLRDRRDPNLGGRQAFRGPDIGIWFNSGTTDGLVIADVDSNGALASAGFREGDRIVSINGQNVTSEVDFVRFFFDEGARADRLPVIVTRAGQQVTLYVEPTMVRDRMQTSNQSPLDRFGVVFDDRYPDRLLVWKVIPQSPAFYAGIRPGDTFVTFAGQPVAGQREFVASLGSARAGMTQLQLQRNSQMRQISIDLPDFQIAGERRTALRPNLDTRPNLNTNNTGTYIEENNNRRVQRRAAAWRFRRR
jgi:C-terminal processing protease CtpA/Prc